MIKSQQLIFGTTAVNQLFSLIITYPDIEVSIRCITPNYLVKLILADTLLCHIVKLVTWVTVTHWYCHYTGLSLERREGRERGREEEEGRKREREGGRRGREEREGGRRKREGGGRGREEKREEGRKKVQDGGKEEWRMEREEKRRERNGYISPINRSSIASFSQLTSLWSSENSAVMLVVSLMNITSCSPSSCSREGTS